MSSIQCILFDFGNTLADQWWLMRQPDDVPQWSAVYEKVISHSEEWTSKWDIGAVTKFQVAAEVARHLSISPERALEIMEENSRSLTFYPNIMRFVKENRKTRRQAMVTLNADLFSEIVVPHYDLGDLFEIIVNSFYYGTNDKAKLCEIVFTKMGDGIGFENSMLIDNDPKHLAGFEERGGKTYQFINDEKFAQDFGISS